MPISTSTTTLAGAASVSSLSPDSANKLVPTTLNEIGDHPYEVLRVLSVGIMARLVQDVKLGTRDTGSHEVKELDSTSNDG